MKKDTYTDIQRQGIHCDLLNEKIANQIRPL